jgi:hypothetical protein
MSMALEAVLAVLEEEKILEGCTDTREAVACVCFAFRESGRFPRPIFHKKIGNPLNIDSKTVWIHWNHFQRHGLFDCEVVGPRSFPMTNLIAL